MLRVWLLLLTLLSAAFAKSYLASHISTPKNYIMNVEVKPCTSPCLNKLLKEGYIFSFLAHANSETVDYAQRESLMIYASYFNIERIEYESIFKVALLVPQKIIGNYAVSTNNAVFAYLMAKNRSFDLKVYYIEDENNKTLSQALNQIKEDGFSYVIAPLTLKGGMRVSKLKPDLNIYFPTIHKSDLKEPYETLYFGGIDYRAQIDALLRYAQGYMALFYDPSSLGKRLDMIVEDSIDPKWLRFSTAISRKRSNLKKYLKNNDLLQNGTIFLNTSTVRSGIVMSQLTLYGIEPSAILSTQINFDPLLLSITQEKDRKNMYIANSIENHHNVLIEANKLLDNDIVYDRINYATILGIDYFLSTVSREQREYSEPMKEHQIIYPIKIYRPTMYGFVEAN